MVLTRLVDPGIEHVIPTDVIPVANRTKSRWIVNRLEVPAHARVDDFNFLRINPEVTNDVPLRKLRIGDHALR